MNPHALDGDSGRARRLQQTSVDGLELALPPGFNFNPMLDVADRASYGVNGAYEDSPGTGGWGGGGGPGLAGSGGGTVGGLSQNDRLAIHQLIRVQVSEGTLSIVSNSIPC